MSDQPFSSSLPAKVIGGCMVAIGCYLMVSAALYEPTVQHVPLPGDPYASPPQAFYNLGKLQAQALTFQGGAVSCLIGAMLLCVGIILDRLPPHTTAAKSPIAPSGSGFTCDFCGVETLSPMKPCSMVNEATRRAHAATTENAVCRDALAARGYLEGEV